MSDYKKQSFAGFKTKIQDGEYSDAGGARRALAKLQTLSEKERKLAARFIDNHFSDQPSQPRARKKTATKKASKPNKGSKPTPKPAKKEKAPAAAPAAAPQKPKAPRAPRQRPAKPGNRAPKASAENTMEEVEGNLAVYEKAVNALSTSAQTLLLCRDHASIDVSQGLHNIFEGISELATCLRARVTVPLATLGEQRGSELFAQAKAALEGNRLQASAPLPAPLPEPTPETSPLRVVAPPVVAVPPTVSAAP